MAVKKIVCVFLVCALLMAGCAAPGTEPGTEGATVQTTEGTVPAVTDPAEVGQMFTERDGRESFSGGTVVALEGDTVRCGDAAVEISGTTVTIRGDGVYILQGTLEDGQIIVEAGESHKPQLVLDSASVTSSAGPALVIRQADKVFVTLAEGSQNFLTGGTVGEGETEDGAVFSRQDLTFNGSGSLTVVAREGHGIVCKDDLKITGGTYQVESASHGLDANDSVRIRDGALTVDAGKDGIHVEHPDDPIQSFVYLAGGSLNIEAEGDGISTSGYLQMLEGHVQILAGGGHENGESHSSGGWGDFMGGGPGGMRPGGRSVETTTEEASSSMKGLKAGTSLWIGGGTVIIDAADDGLHSDASVEIAGGDLTITTGDDGIHGETELTVRGGTINVTESYEGLEALDIRICGGEVSVVATDDGFNAAGGTDDSGNGGRDQMFGGGRPGGFGGHGGPSNGSIVIGDGKIHIQASGDGIDANGYIQIDGGHTVVSGPNSGDTATLDFDSTATINGGIFIGTGASGMAQTFSQNAQGVLAVSMGRGVEAGTQVTVTDAQGEELARFQPELPFSVVIVSTPEMVAGQTYHISAGTAEGDLEAY